MEHLRGMMGDDGGQVSGLAVVLTHFIRQDFGCLGAMARDSRCNPCVSQH